MPTPDFLNMTDEDFAKLDDTVIEAEAPVERPAVEGDAPVEEPATPDEEAPTPAPEAGSEAEGDANADGAAGDGKEGKEPEAPNLSDDQLTDPPQDPKEEPKPQEGDTPPAAGAAPVVEDKDKKPVEGETPAAPVEGEAVVIDHKAEYEKLIGAPITANGKKITLKNADEALRLIQQGANYSQKMEQLKPARRSAAMLEAAGLLGDEAALAQMIDLYNGNPQAIAKMLKSNNIDVFGLDLEAGDQYTPNSHIQSDAAVTFADTLKEIRALEGGREAMTLIDNMDQASKDLIWGNAEAIRQIYEYKQNGVYDTVATELERRRVLGQIPESIPYIVAFQRVGEEIAKAQAPAPVAEQPRTPPVAVAANPAPRAPVATAAAPVKPVAPPPVAAAAAAPRAGGAQAKTVQDIYQLTDADIERMSAPPV